MTDWWSENEQGLDIFEALRRRRINKWCNCHLDEDPGGNLWIDDGRWFRGDGDPCLPHTDPKRWPWDVPSDSIYPALAAR